MGVYIRFTLVVLFGVCFLQGFSNVLWANTSSALGTLEILRENDPEKQLPNAVSSLVEGECSAKKIIVEAFQGNVDEAEKELKNAIKSFDTAILQLELVIENKLYAGLFIDKNVREARLVKSLFETEPNEINDILEALIRSAEDGKAAAKRLASENSAADDLTGLIRASANVTLLLGFLTQALVSAQ